MTIDFHKMGGLIPAIVQDYQTKDVLMVGFMNEEAYQKTLISGTVWFWSRTKNKLWNKGETSGHYQNVKEIFIDCDNDSLLILVEQLDGSTCHTGQRSCFFTKL